MGSSNINISTFMDEVVAHNKKVDNKNKNSGSEASEKEKISLAEKISEDMCKNTEKYKEVQEDE